MRLRALLLAAAAGLLCLTRDPAPSRAEDGPPPPAENGVYRVSVEHANPAGRPRAFQFRARLSGRAFQRFVERWNPPSDRRFATPWSRRREEFGARETRTVIFEFAVPPEAPSLLGAEVQVRGHRGWRRVRAGITVDDGASRRLRPAEAGGNPVPFRILAVTDLRGGLPAGGAVVATTAEWASLRETMGFLAPASWGVYPSVTDPAPLDWAFRGLPAYPFFHSLHAPDLDSETILVIAGSQVGWYSPFWVRSIEARSDGVIECRYSFTPCTPYYAGYILEPFCLGADNCIVLAIPRTDAPIEFTYILE